MLCVELPLMSVTLHAGTGYGYTTHRVNARLLRQFTVFNIPTPTDCSLRAIYSQSVQSTLDAFPPSRFDHRRGEFVEVVL